LQRQDTRLQKNSFQNFVSWRLCGKIFGMSKPHCCLPGKARKSPAWAKTSPKNFRRQKTGSTAPNSALDYDLASICFNGPDAELTKTENAQPGIFLVSWVCFELLKENFPSLKFDATAGLSLGEFTALTAAGAMSFEDGLRVVRLRGKFMQEACDATRGGMAAIIGLDEIPTREVLRGSRGCSRKSELSRPACDFRRGRKNHSGVRFGENQRRAQGRFRCPVAGRVSFAAHGGRAAEIAKRTGENKNSAPIVPVISNVTAQPHNSPPGNFRAA